MRTKFASVSTVLLKISEHRARPKWVQCLRNSSARTCSPRWLKPRRRIRLELPPPSSPKPTAPGPRLLVRSMPPATLPKMAPPGQSTRAHQAVPWVATSRSRRQGERAWQALYKHFPQLQPAEQKIYYELYFIWLARGVCS